MGKLVKPLLIINLLLACGAAAFSFVLYQQRQVIKARTLLLEDSVNTVATNLKHENADALASGLDVTKPPQLSGMKDVLGELNTHAQIRQKDLEMTKETLATTEDTLATTQDDLDSTKSTLSRTSRELSDAKDSLDATESELADAKQTVRNQKNEISGLNDTVQSLNGQIQERDDEIARLQIDLDKRTIEFNNLIDKHNAATTGETGGAWNGRFARVLAVDNEWNYCIIDKGDRDDLLLFLQAHVHRGEEYIGKLIVNHIEENVAVAEIVTDTLAEGESIQPNDTIFF